MVEVIFVVLGVSWSICICSVIFKLVMLIFYKNMSKKIVILKCLSGKRRSCGSIINIIV